MEKTISTEDKIRRAEYIYNQRKREKYSNGTAKVNINSKKDIRMFKKIFIQIAICTAIYSCVYFVKNNNYIFSEDFVNKVKEILSYDVNFLEVYNKLNDKMEFLKTKYEENKTEDNIETNETQDNNSENEESNTEDNIQEDAIGGAEETKDISQMEQDAIEIKNSINFIKPIDGVVTSNFGYREPTTSTVPKFHTGIDIANKTGTEIKSATDGKVILASSEGDYRQTLANSNK